MRHRLIIFGVLVVLSGCSDDIPTCGAENVTDRVVDLARKQIKQEAVNGADPKLQMLGEGKYTVEAIMTQSSSGNKVSCSATLHMTMKSDGLASLDQMEKAGINTKPVIPITYEAQRTDDGKSTYVTLHGLN